jgi:thiol-disulfide isomerase/thioredoxin
MRCALSLTTCLLFASLLRADDAKDLLHAVSTRYDSLTTYEFDGIESAPLPGTGCTLEFPIEIAAALPAFPPAIKFLNGKPSKVCFEAVTKLGSVRSPGEWSHFNSIEFGLKAVKELPQEILRLSGQTIRCTVLEVVYDEYYQKLWSYDGPVYYWIDSETSLIRRVRFTEISSPDTRVWTATLEKVSLGGPAASWLTRISNAWEQPALIGKSAPEFELRTVDGKLVHLTELRGKVVVLDFWATWCGACAEEIPILEQLQTDKAMSEFVLFGITEERASDVREWLLRYKRSFVTFIDAKNTFAEFGIKPIPALVVINRQGLVVDYDLGFHSERLVRELIRKHLSN